MTVSRKEYNHQYYLKNKDKMREQNRIYVEANIDSVRENDRQRGREKYWALRLEAFAVLGNKCQRCGFDDFRALQIDHVHGGGSAENKKGWQWLAKVKENKDQYQILCANCNWIKRHERGESKGRPRAG